MEQKIRKLFDYQTFAKNDRLSAMIADTESRYKMGCSHLRELSFEEMELVNAAGGAEATMQTGKPSDPFADPFADPFDGGKH